MAETEFAPLNDGDRDICQRAVNHFEERNFVESANLFSQIQYRPEDFRIKHNWKVAEFYARNTTDYVDFFKELGSIIKEGEIKVDNLVPEAIKYPVILFNLAVLYYHNKHFRKALDILIQLSRNLSNIINTFAKRVKLLYIDILIKMQQFDKAMEEIDHFESQLKAHGDLSLTTNPSMSTTSSIQSLPRESPKLTCFSPSADSEDSKEIADSNFDASVRIKLQQYRTYCCLCTHSLRSAKGEIKQLFTMTNSNNQNIVGLYLKAYSDYLRGNLKKAVKVIMSFPVENYQKTFSESGDFIEMMVMNNVACCNFYMGKPTIAAFHFQEAGRKFSMEGLEDKKTLPLHAISYSKKYEIVYNFGVSVLHAGKPHEAFKYLNLCLGAYYMNCRLWLRIAECCIQIHKPTNENDLKWTQEKRNLVRGVIGTETNKKVLITDPSAPYSTKNRTSASTDLPEPTLEYANNCIENALKLIQSDTVTNEGCLYVKPSNPITNLQEISCLHAAILCAGAYIALELEDYTLATKRSLDLLGIPSLPGAYQYLGKMYLTQSLFKFGDVTRSLQIYSNECSTFDLRYCVSPLDADDKKDDSIMSAESGWSNASGQVKMLQVWYPNDEVTAQAAFVYNHAVALAASGDTGKAAEVLKAWITKSPTVLPPEFLMLAVYIHVKLVVFMIYSFVFFLVQILNTETPYGLTLSIMMIHHALTLILGFACNLSSLCSFQNTLHIYNMYLQFDRQFSNTFAEELRERNRKFDVTGCMANLATPTLICTFLFMPFSVLILEEHALTPLADLLFPTVKHKLWMKMFWAISFLFFGLYVIFSILEKTLFALMWLHSFNTMSKLSLFNFIKKPTRLKELNCLSEAIKIYRCMYLTNAVVLEMIRLIAPVALLIIHTMHIMAIFATFRLKQQLGMPLYLVMPLTVILMSGVEIFGIRTMAYFNNNSIEFKHKWYSSLAGDPLTRMQIRSFRTLRLEVGSYFYVQRSTFSTFMFSVVNYSISLLLGVQIPYVSL